MKKMTIEALLGWAFRQELCKIGSGGGRTAVAGSSWSMVSDFAALGTLIDRNPNVWGVVPDFVEGGEAHPDALVVGAAVRRLADLGGFDIPAGWNPFPEFTDEHGAIAAEVARVVSEIRLRGDRLSGRHIVATVIGAAILGKGPDWRADPPTLRLVAARGKPAWFIKREARDGFGRIYAYEDDGFDHKRQRPKRGAYRKYELSEPLRGAIQSRLDWQLWRDALSQLHDALSSRLAAHELEPFHAWRQPWVNAAKMEAAE